MRTTPSICPASLAAALAILALPGGRDTARAQEPAFDWVSPAGGAGDEIGLGLAADAAGNTALTGHFNDGAIFGNITLRTTAQAIFVTKCDRAGARLWVRSSGGASTGEGRGVAFDPAGNLYVTGIFTGNLPFTATSPRPANSSAMFLAKLDAAGRSLWTQRAGGDDPAGWANGSRVAIAPNGDCLVAGEFKGAADFGGVTLAAADGTAQAFLARYDPAGGLLWARGVAPAANDLRRPVAMDASGGIWLGGCFSGTAAFAGATLNSRGRGDILVARFDAAGNPVWARQAGGEDPGVADTANAIAVDAAGNVVVAGVFLGAGVFAERTLVSAGATDAFVAKYDAAGKLLWAVSGGGADADSANALALDAVGNVYVTGFFVGSATFSGRQVVTGQHADVFVAKYDRSGRLLWLVQSGGGAYSNGHGIALSATEEVFIGGYFRGNNLFGSLSVPGRGLRDAFIARVLQPPRPALELRRELDRPVLSWRASGPAFSLESSESLRAEDWLPVNAAPGSTGDRRTVTNDFSSQRRFFRLRNN